MFVLTFNFVKKNPIVTVASSFNGFQLYVSNTTSRNDGYACYKVTDPGDPPLIFRKDCSVTGQYVIVYNDVKRSTDACPILELCEVEVYGEFIL